MTDAIRRARIAITQIAEPADPTMNALIKAVGPERALHLATSTTNITDADRAAFAAASNTDTHTAQVTLQAAINTWTANTWTASTFEIDTHGTLNRLAQINASVLIPEDEEWPAALNALPEPPYALYVRGNLAHGFPTLGKTIAVIGSRDATSYGDTVATEVAAGVTMRGYTTITTGGYGIDAAAARGALHIHQGADTVATIVVNAGGINREYPSGNQPLFEQVYEHGIVVSENPLGSAPSRWRFQARQRLIAALAGVTVVVEARWRSGALSIAASAQHMGRAVAAVPGSVHSPNSAGAHRLLAEGIATIVTDSTDVVALAEQQIAESAPAREPADA